MEAQMSLFTVESNEVEVKDIRTKVQLNRKVSYDVGEKIGMARKDLAELKKAFSKARSTDKLREIEDCSNSLAAELINKKELFESFSLETENKNEVEPRVAKLSS